MGVMAAVLARVSMSDLLAVVAVSAGLFGLSLLHQAAPWIGAAVVLGFVSVELGKREAAARQKGGD